MVAVEAIPAIARIKVIALDAIMVSEKLLVTWSVRVGQLTERVMVSGPRMRGETSLYLNTQLEED